MPFLKPACLLAAALGGICLFAAGAPADDSAALNARTNETCTFEAVLKKGELIGSEQVRRLFLTSGTNEFVFVMPQGLRLDAALPDKMVLVSAGYSYSVTLRIIGNAGGEAKALTADSCRERALSRYPGAKLLKESSLTAAGRNGPAFDLHWSAGVGSDRIVRVGFIPSAAGILEFSLIAEVPKSLEAQYAFNSLLLTFRSNADGKLEIIPMSDKT